jgi:hypothetical protein
VASNVIKVSPIKISLFILLKCGLNAALYVSDLFYCQIMNINIVNKYFLNANWAKNQLIAVMC